MAIAAVVGASNLFLYCYFGHLATDFYSQISVDLFASKWITFPLNLQKYFILMIGNSQQPLHYHGFGITFLDLNTYCSVRFFLTFFIKKSRWIWLWSESFSWIHFVWKFYGIHENIHFKTLFILAISDHWQYYFCL